MGKIYKCNECGRIFKRPIELSNHKKWKKIKNDYSKNPKKCDKCGKKLEWEKRYNTFCGKSCANSGENNPQYGIKHTEEYKRKMSEKLSGENHPWFGKHHSEETKRKIAESKLGYEIKIKIGDKNIKYRCWKGGVTKNNIPLYDTYAPQIEWCEEVRRNKKDPNTLEVKCFKCGKWYIPKRNDISHRIQVLKGQQKGEQHLYCSDECKNTCSIYGKRPEQIMKEDAIKAGRLNWLELTREVQPELRKMVLERDEYQCVKCGNTNNLYCHHIYPVSTNPLESADVDNCMTLCIDCHKETHQKDGCGYGQLEVC